MEASIETQRFLAVVMGAEHIVIPLDRVLRILTQPRLSPVYLMPDYARGVINNRGRIVPIFDLSAYLDKGLQEITDESCVILIELLEGIKVGILVDKVEGVRDLVPDSARHIPDSFDESHHQVFCHLYQDPIEAKLVWSELNLKEFPHFERVEEGVQT